MEAIYQDIPRTYTAIAEWISCVIYLLMVEKRFSKNKTFALSLAALMVQILWLVLTKNLPIFFWIPAMMVAVGSMYLYLYICGRFTVRQAGYCCAMAFLTAEFAASLEWQLHTYLMSAGMNFWWMKLLLLMVIYTIVFVGSYFLERSLFTGEFLTQLSGKESLSAVGIVIVIFIFSNMSFVLTDSPFTSRIRSDIFNIRTLVDLCGIAVIYAFQSKICEYIAEKEVTAIQSMLKNQYDQYRSYQDSMEIIRIQYHDLKHHIAGLRAETDVEKRKEWLDTMEKELDENELVGRTGNKVLDVILGAKLLMAKKKEIRITCVADGTLLDFMHVTDICTIFGNALDNAMESVILLEDAEKRLIHVSVSALKNFVFIKISNYCEQELRRGKDGTLFTTKPDEKNHGLGLKSIRYSVEKYKGSVTIDKKNNWFELRILIPVTERR
ncbi:MAG: GHKL domain-containing protein [Eubacteriales bacterium]|nr:GHKL domain-containing protein [Eubacteriales bacterium]